MRLRFALVLLALVPTGAHAECIAPTYRLELLTALDGPIPRGSALVVGLRQSNQRAGAAGVPDELHLESGALHATLRREALVERTLARYPLPETLRPGEWQIVELNGQQISVSTERVAEPLGAPTATEIVWGRMGPSRATLRTPVPPRAALVLLRFTDHGGNEHASLNAVQPGQTRPIVWEPRHGRCTWARGPEVRWPERRCAVDRSLRPAQPGVLAGADTGSRHPLGHRVRREIAPLLE